MSDISVSGKQTKVGINLTQHVKINLDTSLKKYFSSFISANVQFSKSKYNFKCEINIHVESSIFVQSNALSNDAYGAFNIANEKIKKRVRRYHRKLVDHRTNSKKLVKEDFVNHYTFKDPDEIKKTSEIDNPLIVAETEYSIKKITVSEALMLMNLSEENAILFKNSKNNKLNVLYKKKDGNIAWIDPKKKDKK